MLRETVRVRYASVSVIELAIAIVLYEVRKTCL